MKARAGQRLNILSECKELVSNYLDECSQKLFTSKMKKFTLWVQHPEPKHTPIPSPRPCGFKGHCPNYQGYFNHICNLYHYQARSGQWGKEHHHQQEHHFKKAGLQYFLNDI